MNSRPFFVPGSVRMRVTAAILPDGRELHNVPFMAGDGVIVLPRAADKAVDGAERVNALGEVKA